MQLLLKAYKNITNFLKRTERFAYPVGFILMAVLVFGGLSYDKFRLTTNQAYTVGVVKKYSYGSHNVKYVDYIFKVDSIEYYGRVDNFQENNKNIIGWKFVVAYDKENPNTNTVLYHIPLDSTAQLGTILDTWINDNFEIDFRLFFPERSEVKKRIKQSTTTVAVAQLLEERV